MNFSAGLPSGPEHAGPEGDAAAKGRLDLLGLAARLEVEGDEARRDSCGSCSDGRTRARRRTSRRGRKSWVGPTTKRWPGPGGTATWNVPSAPLTAD